MTPNLDGRRRDVRDCATGSVATEMTPARTMTIDITEAKMGD